jgi:hypothetical protein
LRCLKALLFLNYYPHYHGFMGFNLFELKGVSRPVFSGVFPLLGKESAAA